MFLGVLVSVLQRNRTSSVHARAHVCTEGEKGRERKTDF